jgi:hypothetical protein
VAKAWNSKTKYIGFETIILMIIIDFILLKNILLSYDWNSMIYFILHSIKMDLTHYAVVEILARIDLERVWNH